MNLLPQQHLMVEHLHAHPCAALFADPGLGKTLSVLVWLDYLITNGDIEGALIVAPLRVATLTWPLEVEKWFPWMKVADLRTEAGMAAWRSKSAQLYVVNYEQVPKLCAATKEWPVDTLILDEIHFAKNPSSVRMKPLRAARKHFKRVVGMTGTPIGNGYLDIFAPMRLIDGGERLGTAITHFRERYFNLDYMGYTYSLKGDWAREAIQEKIADITLVLKADEYLNIPPVTTVDIDVPLSAANMSLYRTLQKKSLVQIKEQELVGVNAATLVGKLQQFTSGCAYDEAKDTVPIHFSKAEALWTLVQQVNEPLMVVTHFKHEREMILSRTPGAEVFVDASMARWNAGKIPVLVVDPRSAGTGLNMQAGGRHICWFSQTYSRGGYDQMNGRLARTGQTRPVFIHRLLCPDTVDWAVVAALEFKGDEQEGLKTALQALRRIKQS